MTEHGTTDPIERGLSLIRLRRFDAAERYFRPLAERGVRGAWFHLGVALHGLGRLAAAETAFARAIEESPGAPDPRCARAAVLAALGRDGEAEAELREALAHAPEQAQVLFNLAILYERRGERHAAAEHYDRALNADPGLHAARLNRGALRLAQGEPQRALEDFDVLAAGAPTADGLANRSLALLALNRDEDALAAAVQALNLDARHPGALRNRAIALASLGRIAESSSALEAARSAGIALSLGRTAPQPLAIHFARAFGRLAVCDWRDRERLVDSVRDALSSGRGEPLSDPAMLMHALALPLEPGEIRALAGAIAQAVRQRAARETIAAPPARPRRGDRIRVGFLSPEFRDHHGALILRRLFADRDRERFETYAYALNADDGSAVRRELQGAADLFLDVSRWSAGEIASRLRGDALDIVVDRTGYFAGTRPEVLALRPAPIRVSFMGTPCTLGEGLADYRISDAIVSPPGTESHGCEQLARVPAPYALFDSGVSDSPALAREQYGLPDDALVLCHFDESYKIGPEVFSAWMRLLERTPHAVLWLRDGGALTRDNLRREARACGVDPGRLLFAPRTPYDAHLACLAHADLFLDTFFYGARSMAFHALRRGVPVLTMAGATMSSRHAASFVRSTGQDDMITGTPAAYEQRALELIGGSGALDRARSALRAARANAPAFDTAARVRALERAFDAMVARQRAGLPPAHLNVD